ncbi:MAG: peptidoglycan-binding protein [Lewinellaceae bacterium]|nr:peptidoglycan-binding protein [Phaeodactylibacter sp.]MCB9035454.1 peptidoglycan-binding protein [Lewinellaceae bacterium]
MALHQEFSSLLEAKKTESTLKKGAKGPSVETLQRMLYEMGFGGELRWQEFGADGDYGGATTTAVQAFAVKNGLEHDGLAISLEIGARILERFLLLPGIKRLHKALKNEKLPEAFPLDGEEEHSLAPLLQSLGVAADSEKLALKTFAQQHHVPFDGSQLSAPLARKLLDELSALYGDGLPALLSAAPASSGLSLESRKHTVRGNKVTSHRVSFDDLEVNFYGFGSLGGFYNNGELAPKDFIETRWDEFFKDSGLTDSARKAILAVSLNEGKLDAINTWDGAFLSFGMFQWTLGVGDGNGELPALLLKVKQQQPEAFQQYFGEFGIDIDEKRTGTTYGFITLRGNPVSAKTEKEQFRSPEWGFRFWHAGQDPRIQAVEIGHALSRLNNFYWKERPELNGHTLAELINSEYGVALLIDQNVNRGIDVYSSVGDVLDGFRLSNIKDWGDEEEERLIDKYLRKRERTKMHDPQGRAGRIHEVAGEGDGRLSKRRGTFSFMKSKTKSIFPADAAPAPPVGYRAEDYPDIVVEDRGTG